MQGAFGTQIASDKATAPKCTVGKLIPSPTVLDVPGPGWYLEEQHGESSLGQQIRSTRVKQPFCKVGKEQRLAGKWRHQAGGDGACPGSLNVKPASGWLGEEAPKYSFFNKAKRYVCLPFLSSEFQTDCIHFQINSSAATTLFSPVLNRMLSTVSFGTLACAYTSA
jgi:hypothetical protein